MEQITNATGIEYPTLELGGKLYTVKFTRGGLMYRLNKAGTSLAALGSERSFSAYIDILHAALFGQYDGTPEDLAEIVMAEEKLPQLADAVNNAIKKAFPPSQAPAAGTAGLPAAPVN